MVQFYRTTGKRWLDLTIAAALLLLLAVPLVLVGGLVRVFLGRPILFWQRRPGRGGKGFWLCKFRTMTDARGSDGCWLPDEQRMTRFGRVLRATSIDELPELWNVLRGEMSLVGPRPLLMKYLDRYTPRQARRHEVRPGLTGWAQIHGRNAVDWHQRFELDVWYVDHGGFWLDLWILLVTPIRVLQRRGISASGHATTPEFQGQKTMAPRIALAANRKIGVEVLRLLLDSGVRPVALLVASGEVGGEDAAAMRRLLPEVPVLRGKAFRSPEGIETLRATRPDYLLSIHFPYIIPDRVRATARIGTLNLHPALLPFNRGWHTPTWAIADGTPYGATLHWVDGGLDTGDVAMQCRVEVRAEDSADQLYQRVLAAELELIKQAIPRLLDGSLPRKPQGAGTTEHSKADIGRLQQLRLSDVMSVETLLRRLRALTTNQLDEAAYFEKDGVRYRVRVEIIKQPVPATSRAA